MNFNKIESFLADLGAGTALALINDWGILIVNLLIVFGRIAIEILIQKRSEKKKTEN